MKTFSGLSSTQSLSTGVPVSSCQLAHGATLLSYNNGHDEQTYIHKAILEMGWI
jgi:hypothetical protein